MPFENYLRSKILQDEYKKLIEEMMYYFNKFCKCQATYSYSEYEFGKDLVIYFKLDENIFNAEV